MACLRRKLTTLSLSLSHESLQLSLSLWTAEMEDYSTTKLHSNAFSFNGKLTHLPPPPISFPHFMKLSFLSIVICLQSLLFLYRYRPIYSLIPLSLLLIFLLLDRFLSKPLPFYLVDFSCLRPPAACRVPIALFLEHTSLMNVFDEESISFMAKIISSSGQSDESYLPPSLHYLPPKTHLHDCLKEVEMLLFPVMEELFSKTGISALEVDVLVLNCSGFSTAPALASMVVNRFKMREDVKSFNISGMGCSAGAIGITIAESLLRSRRNSYAVVLSAEALSSGWYSGKDRRKLLLNCAFRMGSSAVLLTNRREAKETSKYKLITTLRTNRCFDDKSYLGGIREEDRQGITGFSLEPNILKVMAQTLRDNITILGKSILPLSEKAKYLFSILVKKMINPKHEIYVPDFGSVVDHYCLPVSGVPLINEIGRGLKLRKEEMEAALMTFHRFGNQSSSSMWYEMAYMEGKGRVRKGEKVWQLWMGSGTKCNSLVWECLKDLGDEEWKMGPWFDCLDKYPLVV